MQSPATSNWAWYLAFCARRSNKDKRVGGTGKGVSTNIVNKDLLISQKWWWNIIPCNVQKIFLGTSFQVQTWLRSWTTVRILSTKGKYCKKYLVGLGLPCTACQNTTPNWQAGALSTPGGLQRFFIGGFPSARKEQKIVFKKVWANYWPQASNNKKN